MRELKKEPFAWVSKAVMKTISAHFEEAGVFHQHAVCISRWLRRRAIISPKDLKLVSPQSQIRRD